MRPIASVSAIMAPWPIIHRRGTRCWMSPCTYCQENSAQNPGVARMPTQVSSATRILPAMEISRYSNATPAAQIAADSSSPTKAVRPGNKGRLWASIASMPMPRVEASSHRTG